MKRPLLLLVSLVIFINTQAWELFGPADTVATNICFAELPYEGAIICTDDGMYYYDESTYQWNFYSEANLPVIEGIFLETESILLIMGNGSYSDGIYSFNTSTGQFTVIEYCLEPTFLRFDPTASKYYVGYSGGLLVSADAATWEDVGYFNGNNCLEMSFDYVNMVVSVNELPPNVHRSNNSGETWQSSSSFSPIFRMASYYSSHFFGMCPLNTALSGFYYSDDGGNNWDLEFSSNNISDVSYDQNGFLLISWHSPASEYEGIAMYEPGAGSSGLTFINDGLPTTNILRVKQREGIDVQLAYVCTDAGVFTTWFVGMDEGEMENKLQVYPNPVLNEKKVLINFKQPSFVKSVQLLNLSGEVIKNKTYNKKMESIEFNLELLPPGVYLIKVITSDGIRTNKIIVK